LGVETLPAGEIVEGRYRLVRVIGRGAMAEVYAGEDLRLGRPVAVKLLHADVAVQPESRVRFEEEARAAARLTDPNVVAIYDTGDFLGRPYIVMELLPGRTLHDEIRDGPLSETRVRELSVHVLRAVHAAHLAGVIHRDIKPANILLTASGEAKVADFGIAKVAESNDLTATGLLLGTPSYLAPERVAGQAATVASDLYAVGVVMYEALSGCRPFTGETTLAVCHAISTQDPRQLRDLCPALTTRLADVVARAMARDPRHRYAIANDMIEALAADTVPVPPSIDEPTERIEPEPTVVSPLIQTQAVPVATEPSARRSRLAVMREECRDWTRVHVKLVVAVGAVLIALGLLISSGRLSSNTSTTPPPAKTTTTATVPAALTHAVDQLQNAITP
jgi:eukaryotic-like serine/threonine-protein kinase